MVHALTLSLTDVGASIWGCFGGMLEGRVDRESVVGVSECRDKGVDTKWEEVVREIETYKHGTGREEGDVVR